MMIRLGGQHSREISFNFFMIDSLGLESGDGRSTRRGRGSPRRWGGGGGRIKYLRTSSPSPRVAEQVDAMDTPPCPPEEGSREMTRKDEWKEDGSDL